MSEQVEVGYRTIDSPIGGLLLAASSRGLVRVAFECEGFDHVLSTLDARLDARLRQQPHRLDGVARQLDDYFAHQRCHFDVALDWALSGGFRLQVQRQLTQIGYGQTQSYRQVAELVGRPRAVRAVGTACGTNPLPIVVPCHRVVRSDGGLGGYLGGLEAKGELLRLEGAAVRSAAVC